MMPGQSPERLSIAIVGTGISGMSAAWLLGMKHQVTVFERDRRIGGHSNTISVDDSGAEVPVDTGFIVYNQETYPNLTALFDHFDVPTHASEMSFAVSLDGGRLEYSGGSLAGLFSQKRNFVRPRFWSMLRDTLRFYREAPTDLARLGDANTTLGDYLEQRGYGTAFREDHLLPMASAIWSAPTRALRDYPAASFIRFQENHGLLRLRDRPEWRTVSGGSRAYVDKLTASFRDRIRVASPVISIARDGRGVTLRLSDGTVSRFDHVVIASHADQALKLIDAPTPMERQLLGAFQYNRSTAVLHSDARLMPKRRSAWSSWNYLGDSRATAQDISTVTYWMNRLQSPPTGTPLFVTLNPDRGPRDETVLHLETYDHPLFDPVAMAAQRRLWTLQGQLRTWYCGAYFGAGFHEDGLQAGLAVAEELGGVRRPWDVDGESERIWLSSDNSPSRSSELAA